ncbi:MAG: hypothetical protein WCI55_01065 [Armatimonadota bacterium]
MFNVWSVPKASLLPAFLLACLVLFTYSTLQNYGPESTVRKFHTALHSISQAQSNNKQISKRDWDALRSVIEEDIGNLGGASDPANRDGIAIIGIGLEQFRLGKTYSLARMDRLTREVRIAVLYQKNAKSPSLPIVWVVDKPVGGREWKISARKTLSAMPVP